MRLAYRLVSRVILRWAVAMSCEVMPYCFGTLVF